MVEGDYKTTIKRVEIMEKAHNATILSLANKVLQEMSKESTTAAVWFNLESLHYMTK